MPAAALAGDLPNRLAPDEPFPRILAEAPTLESIAPGIEYADYAMETAAGPLAIHIIAVEPRRSDVRVENVLADNALESHGETVGSMAKRTGAVAGINGDYFDIGNTNRPLNIVVRNGTLLQMPRKRYALAIARDGSAQIAEFSFMGQVSIGDRTTNIDAIDEMPPPNGGTSLLTPDYGSVAPEENLTLIALERLDGAPPLARYRVTGIVDNLRRQPPGFYVAVGPGAYNSITIPDPGTSVVATGDLSPVGLDQIVAAIGGGPLILHNGDWFDDPDGPRGGEYEKRIPCTGAAIAPDGRLFLIEVDGRQSSVSVGLTRREFSALMRALGATEGLAFDGGGSSTVVVRRVGDEESAVVNSPSDGIERPVGDGLFVYSTAPVGDAVRLVAQPGVIRAVTGAEVPLRIAAVDAANHVTSNDQGLNVNVEPPRLGIYRDGQFTALEPGEGSIVLRSGHLSGKVGLEVQRSPAGVAISPLKPNVDRDGSILLTARAYDARGYRLALPPLLVWSASAGNINARGEYHAQAHDANVAVKVGEAGATTHITVGTHEVGLPFAEHVRFATMPRGGGGEATRDVQECGSCVALRFNFTPNEHAAYAMADVPLPENTIGLAFDVQDDGSDARLRVALRNSINEDVLADATVLDQQGWRHVVVRFPAESAQAARLVAIYVLPPRGMQLSNGQIVIRNVRAVVAGE